LHICAVGFPNDVYYFNAAYKLGVKKFYNTIRVGNDFDKNFSVGYGIGTQCKLGNKFNFNFDLSSNLIFKTDSFRNIGLLGKLTTSLDYNFNKYISIFIGPSYNISLVPLHENDNSYANIAPYSFYDKIFSDTQIKMWVGGVFGLSFTL